MPITDPTDIADLSLWLRADSLSLSDGAFVNTWTDESPNARSFTAVDAEAPIFQTNELNSLPVLEFGAVAVDDVLESGSFDAVGGLFNGSGDAVVIFIVMLQAGSLTDNGNLSWSSFGTLLSHSNTLYFDAANTTTGRISVAQPGGWDDAFHIVELWRSGSNGEIVVDASVLVASTFSASLASGSFTMKIGLYAGIPFKGKIAELVVYKRGLNSTERGDVYDYLNVKWFGAGPSVNPRLGDHHHVLATI